MRDLFPGCSGTYDVSRHAHRYRIRRDVAAHHTARANHAAFAHMRAIEKNCIRAHPDVVFNDDAHTRGALLTNRNISPLKIVVFRMKAHVLAHDHVFADGNKAGAAEEGIGVDGGIGAHADAFTQVGGGRADDHRVSADLHIVPQDHAPAHETVNDYAALERHAFAKTNERRAPKVDAFSHENSCNAALQNQSLEHPTHQPDGASEHQSQQ